MPDSLAGNDLAGNDMVTVVEGPGSFRRLDHVPIPLADGTRLGARIWIPDGAEAHPVPAILEYIPYRKNDLFAVDDEGRFGYFAAHGYAGVRLDIRGSGDSEGVLIDEYALQEQDDALEAIAWIASQPWCSGAVGMIGRSWGGFNGLQVAARRPPALKAIVTVYSTDDRYADDAHYIGGCLLTHEMLGWGTNMHTVATLPPTRCRSASGWKQMWQERLDGLPPADPHLAQPPAPGRLLEARLGQRGLRRHHLCRLRHRRLVRRLPGPGVPADGGPLVPEEGAHRPVGAPVRRWSPSSPAPTSGSSRSASVSSTSG